MALKRQLRTVFAFCLGALLSHVISTIGGNFLASFAIRKSHSLKGISSSNNCDAHMQDTLYNVSFQLSLPAAARGQSSFRVSSLYGMNFATGSNVCVKPDHSKTVFLYSDDLPDISEESGFLQELSGFRFGWQFEVVKTKIPPAATLVPGTTIVLSPAYTHHVTHFAESSIPLWHAFSHSDVYPVHSHADRIFLKQSDFHSELMWNRQILAFLSYYANASIVDSTTFRSSSLICFEAAGMVGMGLHEFGFFANEREAQTFRRQILRFYTIPVQNHSSLMHQSRYARVICLQYPRSFASFCCG